MPVYEQPSQAPQHVITGTGAAVLLGTGDDTGTPDFFIKVISARFRSGSRLYDITGDGDTTETWLNNKLLYGTFNLSGAMIADNAIGFANIIDTQAGGNAPVLLVVFNLGGARSLRGSFFVEYIDVDWNRKAPYVGIRMTGKTSGVTLFEGLDQT